MRPEKTAFVNQITEVCQASEYLILTDYQGLTVAQTEIFRNQLAEVGAQYQIVKNTILKLVAQKLNISGMEGLNGPTAMVFGEGDVVQVAKIVRDFVKANKKMSIKQGAINGKSISAADVDNLAEMPPREIMLGMLVGTIAAPMTQLVGVCQQKMASVVYVLKAIQDKKENG